MLPLILLPLELALAAVLLVAGGSLKAHQAQLRRIRLSMAEGKRLSEAKMRVRDRHARVERSLDRSTDTVEAVHLALADLSFDIWGGRDSAGVRAAHHKHAGSVYEGIRFANRGVSRLVSGLFKDDGGEKSRDAGKIKNKKSDD